MTGVAGMPAQAADALKSVSRSSDFLMPYFLSFRFQVTVAAGGASGFNQGAVPVDAPFYLYEETRATISVLINGMSPHVRGTAPQFFFGRGPVTAWRTDCSMIKIKFKTVTMWDSCRNLK
jgi:hypothetical protein